MIKKAKGKRMHMQIFEKRNEKLPSDVSYSEEALKPRRGTS